MYLDRLPARARPTIPGCKQFISTPDGGILYITSLSVTFIKTEGEEKPLILFFDAKQPIVEIDIIPGWPKEKLFAMLTSSNSILIWDLNKNIAICGHKAHPSQRNEGRNGNGTKGESYGRMSFMKNRNLLSITPSEIVIYCIASNSTLSRSNFIRLKGFLTVLKCSPYDERIFACGTNKGSVLVCDLQKSCTLYTFDGHDSEVLSLSWNAIDLIAPVKKLVKSVAVSSPLEPADGDDIFNIYDYDYLENEFGAPVKGPSADEDKDFLKDTSASELSADPNFNFTEACESLKQDINAINESTNVAESNICDAVTLADCLETKNLDCSSSADLSNGSTEGSLELLERNSSSDESCHVDGMDVTLMEQETHLKSYEHQSGARDQQIEGKADFDVLLASSSRNGKVYIRNITTGSFCDQIKKSAKFGLSSNAIWISPTELMFLNQTSDFCRRKLNKNKLPNSDTVRAFKLETDEDESNKFVAVEEVIRFDRAIGSDLLWYSTNNYKVVCLNTYTREIVLNYDTTYSGLVTLSESPENTFKIAYSLPTNGLCLMNTVEDLKLNKITIHYQPIRLTAPIKRLAWHANGYDLAYGTIKGQVGLYNVDLRSHNAFDVACARQIYSLTWFNDYIFCVCNEKVFAYKPGLRVTLKLEGLDNESFSAIEAYENFLIVGTNRGAINLYKQKETSSTLSFALVKKVEVAHHYITEITINPIGSEQFAVVANEAYVYIYKIDPANETIELLHEAFAGDPRVQIHSIKWSNRQQSKLVASGFDGELRVFDLSRPHSEQVIFSRKFPCPLLCAMFLPTDERFVICLGKTLTVEIVDTENPCSEIHEKHTLDQIKWATQLAVSSSTGSGGGKKRRRKQQLNSELLAKAEKIVQPKASAVSDDLIDQLAEIEIADTCRSGTLKSAAAEEHLKSNFLKNPQTALILITKEQNKQALLKIHEFVTLSTFKEKRDAVLIARLFGNKIDAQKILTAELANVKLSGSSIPQTSAMFLNQLNGGFRNQILEAIQNRQLKEWHVALAPSISYSFWKKCTQAFAEQLLEQGHALQAAIYMLSLHKQYEAIEMLMSKKYFKEALLIARVHLDDKNSLFNYITDEWIKYLEGEGNLHAAALICTVSEQYKRAADVLSKQRVAGPEVEAAIRLLKAHLR